MFLRQDEKGRTAAGEIGVLAIRNNFSNFRCEEKGFIIFEEKYSGAKQMVEK